MPLLMTAGPVECCPRVLEACSKKMISHRGPEFRKLFNSIEERLNKFLRASFTAIIAGTGTTAVDAMCWSLVARGEKVAVVIHGEFGERMAETLRRRGAKVIELRANPGRWVPLERLREVLDEGVDAVALVHNETSTGLLYAELSEIAEECSKRGVKLLVDTVSSAFGEHLDLPNRGTWAIAYASHKALAAPPGACFVSMSSEAVEELGKMRLDVPLLLDLSRYIEFAKKLETPYTPPISVLWGVEEALNIIEETGLRNWIEAHRERASILYQKLPELGLEPLVKDSKHRSNTVAAFLHPRACEIVEELRIRGFIVSRGMGSLKNKALRIGVMGCIGVDDVQRLVEELESIVKGLETP